MPSEHTSGISIKQRILLANSQKPYLAKIISRPELKKAIALYKKERAELVEAKMDRLSVF